MASNKKDLKAYVRIDGTGRVIAGSLILQRFKPKVGHWQEIQAYECCDPSCPNPVYGQDWIVDGVESIDGGIILTILTNPYENFTMQLQSLSCETGKGLGNIITVGPETDFVYNWFIPTDINNDTCGLLVRKVCGVNYHSNWSIGAA